MKIQDQLIQPYEIWQDKLSFSVGVPKEQKDKTIVLTNPNYFNSLSMCLLHIVKLKMVAEDKVVDLQSYINKYEAIKYDILSLIKH